VALLATTAGCATEVLEAGAEATQAIVTPPGGPCARFVCGANSPVIDTYELHELSLNPRERNSEGFELDVANKRPQIVQAQVAYELRVENGRIGGFFKGSRVLDGEALVGATIPVRRGKEQYEIAILSVHERTFFVEPRDPIESYTLAWRAIGRDQPYASLCNGIEELRKQAEIDPEGAHRETMGLEAAEAVVFEGDRVDARTKEMGPAANDRWFNIGCAGHTLSKLWLTHNTVHSQDPALPRAWEQRQATLKMLVADYCNTGKSFTVAGQPLVWQGASVQYFSSPRELEARWTEAGAACVYAPRMLFPTPLGQAAFPDIWKAIYTECNVNVCSNLGLTDQDYDGADRMSANPY
jgi:hypothetical protein